MLIFYKVNNGVNAIKSGIFLPTNKTKKIFTNVCIPQIKHMDGLFFHTTSFDQWNKLDCLFWNDLYCICFTTLRLCFVFCCICFHIVLLNIFSFFSIYVIHFYLVCPPQHGKHNFFSKCLFSSTTFIFEMTPFLNIRYLTYLMK